MVRSKIQSFSHTEHNTSAVMNSLKSRMEDNKDPLLRDWYQYRTVKIDDSYPEYIMKNQDKLAKWIK